MPGMLGFERLGHKSWLKDGIIHSKQGSIGTKQQMTYLLSSGMQKEKEEAEKRQNNRSLILSMLLTCTGNIKILC